MREPMYLLDFRRMSVEKIERPQPPTGIEIGALEVPDAARSADITFAVCGSIPVSEEEE